MPLPATLLAAVTVAVVLASRGTGTTVPATSGWVVLATTVAAAAVLVRLEALDEGWEIWRRAVGALATSCLVYPLLWATAVLASEVAPDGATAWLTAVLASTAHLPLLAAFSVCPLLAARYLGRGSGRGVLVAVTVSGVAAFVAFALLFDDHAPLRARAPVRWDGGDALGAGVHLVFLATVLLGPLLALRAAWRADGEAARRLALVAGSALAGTALVMLCGAVGSLGGAGAVLVLAALPVAVAVVAIGCTSALTTRDLPAPAPDPAPAVPTAPDPAAPAAPTPTPSPGPVALTRREGEVVALLAQGLSNAGIAARLVVSERTVDAHLRSAFTKLDLPDGPEQNRRVHAVLAWQGASAGTTHRT